MTIFDDILNGLRNRNHDQKPGIFIVRGDDHIIKDYIQYFRVRGEIRPEEFREGFPTGDIILMR